MDLMNNCYLKSVFFLFNRIIVRAFALLLLVIACLEANAQLEIIPAGPVFQVTDYGNTENKRTAANVLQVPFFDDFSTTKGFSPDTTRWMPGGGTFVNNTFSTSHPSVNMVVFDGLNGKGMPYSFENIQAASPTDTLTSRAIDLSRLSPADSVYLSFYVQPAGLVEMPDESDTLICEFLGADGQWKTVWRKFELAPGTDFFQVLLGLKDKNFFHAGFQFRFVSYGRLNGPFDVWLLDYILLDKNRRWNDTFEKDATVTIPLTSYLKRYTAMPVKQYLVNPSNEVAPSVTAGIYNLHSVQNVLNYEFTTTNAANGSLLSTSRGARAELIMSRERQFRAIENKPVSIPGQAGIRLKHHFKLITSDEQNPPIQGVDLRQNDTLSSYTDLTDYYAYDDGSAEYGVRMNRRQGRVAVRYILNKPDTLAGVRISFVPFLNDISSQGFAIHVYNNNQGLPGDLLYQQAGQISYGDARNEFIYFPFNSGVAVSDTFFIGWMQTSEVPLAVGYDRNSLLGSKQVFSNISQDWYEETSLEGSLMIRPVTGGKPDDVITGNEPRDKDYYLVYPNPTEGVIYWKNDKIMQVEVIDITGRILKRYDPQGGIQQMIFDELQNGLYFIRLYDGQSYHTQKVLLRK